MRLWKPGEDFSVSVVVAVDLERIPLVRNVDKPDPRWQFPGGRKEENNIWEEPRHGGQRELAEETGLQCSGDDLEQLVEQHRTNHHYFMFGLDRPDSVDFATLKSVGDEGEEIGLFHFVDVLDMAVSGELFGPHARFLKEDPLVLAFVAKQVERLLQ